MTRLEGWEKRLALCLRQAQRAGFAWGGSDCCLMVAAAIHAMTGEDVGAPFRGAYDTEIGAARLLRREFGNGGVESMAEAMSARYDMPERPPVHARRGDVLLYDSCHGPALGIVGLGGTHGVFTAPEGLTNIPVARCRRAWAI